MSGDSNDEPSDNSYDEGIGQLSLVLLGSTSPVLLSSASSTTRIEHIYDSKEKVEEACHKESKGHSTCSSEPTKLSPAEYRNHHKLSRTNDNRRTKKENYHLRREVQRLKKNEVEYRKEKVRMGK